MSLRITVPPTDLPVSVIGCKAHMRVDADLSAEDSYIEDLIGAAVLWAQRRLRRQLCTATGVLELARFPADGLIVIDRPPLAAVTSITYLDAAGDEQTLATDQYTVDTASQPGRILRPSGVAWPVTYMAHNAVTITATVGYGEADDVPADYRLAIMYLVAHWFAIREPVEKGSMGEVPMTVDSLLGDRDLRF